MNNTTTNSVAGALTRHGMTAGGVAGILSAQNEILQFVSLLITITGVVWSIVEKFRRPNPPVPPSPPQN